MKEKVGAKQISIAVVALLHVLPHIHVHIHAHAVAIVLAPTLVQRKEAVKKIKKTFSIQI